MKWCKIRPSKIIIAGTGLIGVAILLLIMIKPDENIDKNKLLQYLQKKYQSEFQIEQKIDQKDTGNGFAYHVSPTDNEKLIFTVESGYTNSSIFPFLPALRRVYYKDDLSDQIKAYVIAQNIKSIENIKVEEAFDVSKASEDIYNLMGMVNDELKNYNMSTTDYTCEVELLIMIGNEKQLIDFYKRDKRVIENLLLDQLVEK